MQIVHADGSGLRCDAGNFWVDPWKKVDLAVITHGHADHARPGMGRYLCSDACLPILRARLPRASVIESVPFGQTVPINGADVSFFPAGHCRGASQVRIETAEGVAVAAGDYKRAPDPTCDGFEVVPCDVFVTESTFALPVYRWDTPGQTADEILDWWEENREAKKVSALFSYSLGKAQRVLGELALAMDRRGIERRRVFIHGALEKLTGVYRDEGVDMLKTWPISESARARGRANPFKGELIIAPPGAAGSPWMRRFGPAKDVSTAMASGWMRFRGGRRRMGYDRGFVLSDHADWDDLVRTCVETGAKRVLCTHGNSATLARYLREMHGIEADVLETAFEGEGGGETEVSG
ncbi:MAG: ligase-associated DNA damage response exonuclease [Planctomycetota bacterium]